MAVTPTAHLLAMYSDDSRGPCVASQAAAMHSEDASADLDLVAIFVEEVGPLPTDFGSTDFVVVPMETLVSQSQMLSRTSESLAYRWAVLDHHQLEQWVVLCNCSSYREVHSEDLH